jgi:hypothetical protein
MVLVYPVGPWRRNVLAVTMYFQCETKIILRG